MAACLLDEACAEQFIWQKMRPVQGCILALDKEFTFSKPAFAGGR